MVRRLLRSTNPRRPSPTRRYAYVGPPTVTYRRNRASLYGAVVKRPPRNAIQPQPRDTIMPIQDPEEIIDPGRRRRIGLPYYPPGEKPPIKLPIDEPPRELGPGFPVKPRKGVKPAPPPRDTIMPINPPDPIGAPDKPPVKGGGERYPHPIGPIKPPGPPIEVPKEELIEWGVKGPISTLPYFPPGTEPEIPPIKQEPEIGLPVLPPGEDPYKYVQEPLPDAYLHSGRGQAARRARLSAVMSALKPDDRMKAVRRFLRDLGFEIRVDPRTGRPKIYRKSGAGLGGSGVAGRPSRARRVRRSPFARDPRSLVESAKDLFDKAGKTSIRTVGPVYWGEDRYNEWLSAWERKLIEEGYSEKFAKQMAYSMLAKDLYEDWWEYVEKEMQNLGFEDPYVYIARGGPTVYNEAYGGVETVLVIQDRKTGRKKVISWDKFMAEWQPDFVV